MPRRLVIFASYILSLVALETFGSLTSGMLYLLDFIFLTATMYHLYWFLKAVGAQARLAIVSGLLLVIGGCGIKLSRGDSIPVPLKLRIGLFFS